MIYNIIIKKKQGNKMMLKKLYEKLKNNKLVEKKHMNLDYLKDKGHNLMTLGAILKEKTQPFIIESSLYDNELSEDFKMVDGTTATRYQVLYLALSEADELYLTTLPDEAKAYIPITNIYDYQFPRTGELREEMERISREYTKDFRQYVFDYTQRFSATLLTYKLGDVVLEFI